MKRSLLIATVSALVLALFALPLRAQTVAPLEGEPALEEIPPSDAPLTPYEACVAEALDPAACDAVPVAPPVETCPPEGCGAVDTVPEEPQVNQTALMAAEEAASDAVADVVAEEGPDAVDSAAAYLAGLGAAREAARGVGADEETAEALAESAAIGAIAREAAFDAAAGGEGFGAVDGAAAYLAALGAAREAGASEERAPAAGRAAATRSDGDVSGSEEAESAAREAGTAKDEAAEDEEPSDTGSSSSSEEETPSAGSATSTEGETPPAEEEPFEAVATALPTAEGASPLVLAVGALLVIFGIVGLLVRRRLALRNLREPEEQQAGEGETSQEEATVRRLPQRTVR